ncbi:hypothetical protein [Bacillus cereus]|nr:hypothetical protein [Bacillus cereus]
MKLSRKLKQVKTITKEMEEIIKAKVTGKITHEQFITLADAIARRELT